MLARISAIAEHKDIALLLIHHLNKTTATSDPLLKVSGSVAFTAAPRSVLILGSHPEDAEARQGERVLAHAKSNLAEKAPSLACRIESAEIEHGDEVIPTSRIRIGDESPFSASDVIGAAQEF